MTYYLYDTDSNEYAGIGVDSEQGRDPVDIFYDDSPLVNDWTPVRCHTFDDFPQRQGDFPCMFDYGEQPVMSRRAWELLQPLIGYCCEALPIVHPSGDPYFIVHVMETIDCLDEARSKLRRSKIDGRVNRIFRYCFKEEMLQEKHIFKLPLESGGGLIVDDVFRKTVDSHGLQGLLFKNLPIVN